MPLCPASEPEKIDILIREIGDFGTEADDAAKTGEGGVHFDMQVAIAFCPSRQPFGLRGEDAAKREKQRGTLPRPEIHHPTRAQP